jgi:phosphatidylserine/phosphatidylglycerophosphate/cardiolipin synthase-like enzyme
LGGHGRSPTASASTRFPRTPGPERVEVRVLLWAGPPVPAFQPTRKMVRAVRAQLTAGNRIECVLDARERSMHCHHEKLVIVDDTVAFVGGVNLTSLAGDRWDST